MRMVRFWRSTKLGTYVVAVRYAADSLHIATDALGGAVACIWVGWATVDLPKLRIVHIPAKRLFYRFHIRLVGVSRGALTQPRFIGKIEEFGDAPG